jgi:hypothetical protein
VLLSHFALLYIAVFRLVEKYTLILDISASIENKQMIAQTEAPLSFTTLDQYPCTHSRLNPLIKGTT